MDLNIKNCIYFDNEKEIIDNYEVFNDSWLYGSNSRIYRYNNNSLLKVFLNKEKEDKISLFEYYKSLNLSSTCLPNKYLFIREYFSGYLMSLINGKKLSNLGPNIKLDHLLASIRKIENDINLLSDNNIVVSDLNYQNIIYNEKTNESTLIDLDQYFINDRLENLKLNNIIYLYDVVFASLSLIECKALETSLYKEIRDKINNLKEVSNIEAIFNELFNYMTFKSKEKIETVGDIRKVLRKK